MNRADKLFAVLRDGREHSRQDVFDAEGFMLTNNAAAELRARGYDVRHRRRGGLDMYQLVGSLDALAHTAASALPPSGRDGGAGASSEQAQSDIGEDDGQLALLLPWPGQLAIEAAA